MTKDNSMEFLRHKSERSAEMIIDSTPIRPLNR